jgi:hypothetical protein
LAGRVRRRLRAQALKAAVGRSAQGPNSDFGNGMDAAAVGDAGEMIGALAGGGRLLCRTNA